jgi:hypothetical protein
MPFFDFLNYFNPLYWYSQIVNPPQPEPQPEAEADDTEDPTDNTDEEESE